MLKIFEKPASGEGEPVAYLFHFNSGDPRPEANALKDLLSRLMAGLRSNDPSIPKPVASEQCAATPDGTTQSVAAASAQWFDDRALKTNIELQQSLMRKDRVLQQTYMDARLTKPPSISDAAFNSQFWSTRTTLLRAHAIEIHQKKGAYNVLPTVKIKHIDENRAHVDISVEQVQMILQQHPLVRRIYNENVPKPLSESEFWTRFFLTKLSKRLRGERVDDNSGLSDPVFDKYDAVDDINQFSSKITMLHGVPHTIDVAGNDENQGGFRSGNRPDQEMRPGANVPIVRTLNSMSEKIMANVAPTDHDPTAAAGMDEETYRELHLRDLQGDKEAARIMLNIKEQNKFFSNQNTDGESADAKLFEAQDPSEVLAQVRTDFSTLHDDSAGGLDLHKSIGIDDESDSDADEEVEKRNGTNTMSDKDHVGSRRSRQKAQDQILDGMRQKRGEFSNVDSDDATPMEIDADLTQRCYVTNATTAEFLRQFWNAFLSGNPDRAMELAYHVESLKRSQERIEALAAEAEEQRAKVIQQKKELIVELFQRTQKRVKGWSPEMVRGGRKEVLTLLGPMLQALGHALRLYQSALEAEGLRATTE
jgi:transcription initiation factor TFIIH subunit 1